MNRDQSLTLVLSNELRASLGFLPLPGALWLIITHGILSCLSSWGLTAEFQS